MFQIATENKNVLQSKKQDDYLMIDSQIAKNSIEYLDSELESGYPVLVVSAMDREQERRKEEEKKEQKKQGRGEQRLENFFFRL